MVVFFGDSLSKMLVNIKGHYITLKCQQKLCLHSKDM